MKTFALILSMMALSATITGQNQVSVEIHHLLNDKPFSLNQKGTINIGHEVTFSRLQYYLSSFRLIDESGNEIAIDSTWALVNADSATVIDLGPTAENVVAKIGFAVGVDSANNHLDPSSWPAGHPLHHQWPSMHWGWVSGYRFVALEGNANGNADFQIHALGDANYYMQYVEVNDTAHNGKIEVEVYADYSRALDDIYVNQGIINHGETDEAHDCIINFRDRVFTATPPDYGPDSSLSVREMAMAPIKIYPNPVVNESITISNPSSYHQTLSLIDASGRVVRTLSVKPGISTFNLGLDSGIYMMSLTPAGDARLTSSRLVVLH
ncbi:MAG: hypothetical protein Kow0075_12060 [Salibacteraceae bacterium]